MGSNYTGLVVTHYSDSSSYGTSTNITTDVLSLPLFTDTGTGEVNECEIVVSAKDGKYVNTGLIIKEFDRFRIQLTDLSVNSYDRYFEVTDLIPTQTKSAGSTLTIRCLGIEYHTQMINYSRRDWFESSYNVATHIAESYGENKGSRQPTLTSFNSAYSTSTKKGVGLPDFTNNHYEFGQNEDNHYNRFMDLVDLLGGSGASGGVGDFFELGFDTPSVTSIALALFSSGGRSRDVDVDADHITIKNTQSLNVSEQEGVISNPTGTNLLAWGSSDHGTLPIEQSEYRSLVWEFLYRPIWNQTIAQSGVKYVQGAKVLHQKRHYESLVNDNNMTPGNPAFWRQIDMASEFGNRIQYSQWTDDKTALWVNSGTDPNSANGTLPAYSNSTNYQIYDLVQSGGVQYRSLTHLGGAGKNVTDTALWEVVDSAHLGNGAGFYDSNLVVKDKDSFRTWVNFISAGAGSSTTNTEYRHANGEYPLGTRVLNISVTPEITGNDPKGISYTNTVIERRYDDLTGATNWFVLYTPSVKTDRMQVVSLGTGIVLEWLAGSSTWFNISHTTTPMTAYSSSTTYSKGDLVYHSQFPRVIFQSQQDNNLNNDTRTTRTNVGDDYWKVISVASESQNDDCIHTYFSIQNIKGVDSKPHETDNTTFPDVTANGNKFTKNINSAIEAVYKFGVIDNNPKSQADFRKGLWLNFAFPFPMNSFHGIQEGVGDLYGGGTNESIPPRANYLDTENMTWTHDGRQGFNNESTEDLGVIQSLAFHMRVSIRDIALNDLDGEANIRCTMYDTNDNVAVQDFKIDFTNGVTWQPVNLSMGGFNIYKGRQPKSYLLRGLSILGFQLPIPELELTEQFEFRHIKLISFQLQDVYDDDGRYNPEKDMLEVSNQGISTAPGGVYRMAIDSLHFKKALLVTSGVQTLRNLEPAFLQRPNIISYTQLKNDVNTQLEIEQFKHKEFNFQTSGKDIFDLRFGDTFFLENNSLISDTDDTTYSESSKKKIKLVAKRIEYHLTKPLAGSGGLTRSIKGVKRFA
tara:strand:- start:593 stop:3670 length:3078 start_codon:yes stop_codon:yes gene_type:complete